MTNFIQDLKHAQFNLHEDAVAVLNLINDGNISDETAQGLILNHMKGCHYHLVPIPEWMKIRASHSTIVKFKEHTDRTSSNRLAELMVELTSVQNPEPEGTEHINKALAERFNNNKEESQMTERELDYRNEVTKVVAYVNTGVLDEATAQGIYVQLVLKAIELRIDIPDVISTRLNPASLKCIAKITGVPNAPKGIDIVDQLIRSLAVGEDEAKYLIKGNGRDVECRGKNVSFDMLLKISEQHELLIARVVEDLTTLELDVVENGVILTALCLPDTAATEDLYSDLLEAVWYKNN